MRKVSVLAIALLLPFIMFSQTSDVRYKINFALLQAIEDYESLINLNEDRMSRYLDMFESPQTRVYNDLLGLSYKKTLTAQEYGNVVIEADNFIKSKIISVKKGKITEVPGGYEVVVSFGKSMEYTDNRGALYSASEFYGEIYAIDITYVYNPELDRCLIREITGHVKSDKVLSENHIVLQRDTSRKKSNSLYSDVSFNGGQHLEFNSVNQMFLPDNLKYDGFNPDIKVSDSDIYLKPVTTSTGLTELKFSRRRARLGFYYGMSLFNDLNFDNKDIYKAVKSSASEYGVQLGVMFGTAKKTRAGFTLGAGKSSGKMRFIGNGEIIESTDHADYTTITMMTNRYQEMSYSHNTASFAFNIISNFTPRIAMNIDFMYKVYLNGIYDIDKYNFTCTLLDRFTDIDGTYYDSVIESRDYSYDSYMSQDWELVAEEMPMTVAASLGMSYFLTRSLYVSAKVGYEIGISEHFTIKNPSEAGAFDTDSEKAISPLITSGTATKGAPWLQIGLTVKF